MLWNGPLSHLSKVIDELDLTTMSRPVGWVKIKSLYDEWETFSCKPSKSKVKEGHVFDENMSVKWNKEKVITHNEAVTNEARLLNQEKNNKFCVLKRNIVNQIVADSQNRMTLLEASELWDMVESIEDFKARCELASDMAVFTGNCIRRVEKSKL